MTGEKDISCDEAIERLTELLQACPVERVGRRLKLITAIAIFRAGGPVVVAQEIERLQRVGWQ